MNRGAWSVVLLALAIPAHGQLYRCEAPREPVRYTDIASSGCRQVRLAAPAIPKTPATQAGFVHSAADLERLTAEREKADPAERLQRLEDWARGPRDSLDAVTHALVDPDETVRARAQALMDEALAAR